VAGLSADDDQSKPGQEQAKTEQRRQASQKMGLCWGLGLVEAGVASASRAQPAAGPVVAGERGSGFGVADRVAVVGLGLAAEPVAMAGAGWATGMAAAGLAVVAGAAAGDDRLPGLDGGKLAARGKFGGVSDRALGVQPGLCGLWEA